MPLIRHGHIVDALYKIDASSFEGLSKKDDLRCVVGGKDISFRQEQLKKAAYKQSKSPLITVARDLAEPGVDIKDDYINMLGRALKLSVASLNKVFAKASCVGVGLSSSDLITKSANVNVHCAAYPTAAKLINNQIFIAFRFWKHTEYSNYDMTRIELDNSVLMGFSAADLEFYSPDMAKYIGKLQEVANRDEVVEQAYATVMNLLRPEQAAEKARRKLLERYESNQAFGMWA